MKGVQRSSLQNKHTEYMRSENSPNRRENQLHFHGQREFLEREITQQEAATVSKFIDARISNQIDVKTLDHRDELRRLLASNREEHFMQIEHHLKEYHKHLGNNHYPAYHHGL